MKKLLLILLCLPSISIGQTSCHFTKTLSDGERLCNIIDGNSSNTDLQTELALERILSVIGLPQNFKLISCNNIENCVAATYNGKKYILYDKAFMNIILNNTNAWTQISILAHEIGHHVHDHTSDVIMYEYKDVQYPTLQEKRTRELEADEFSGFVMYKLGATLEQSQQAIKLLSTNADDTYSTHPSKNKRLKAIERGYYNAKRHNSSKPTQIYFRNKIINIESITKPFKAGGVDLRSKYNFLLGSGKMVPGGEKFTGIIYTICNNNSTQSACKSAYMQKDLDKAYQYWKNGVKIKDRKYYSNGSFEETIWKSSKEYKGWLTIWRSNGIIEHDVYFEGSDWLKWDSYYDNGQISRRRYSSRPGPGSAWDAGLTITYEKNWNKNGEVVSETGSMNKTSTNNTSTNKTIGCVSGDCENGYGVYVYTNGDRYKGHFENGERDGIGYYKYNDGAWFRGGFDQNKRYNGGIYVSETGKQYFMTTTNGEWQTKLLAKGCFFGNCENGLGIYLYSGGSIYYGYFKNGKRNGFGMLFYNDEGKINSVNDTYVGYYKNNKRHGSGTYYFEDGSTKDGDWNNSEFVK